MKNVMRALGAAGVGVLAVGALVVPAGSAGAAGDSVTPACGNADLEVGYRAADAAMSHRYGRIVLTNVSDHACSTGGYGGLSYVGGGDGTQVGAAADRDGGKVTTFVLEPGEKAASRVDETVAGVYPKRKCRPTAVDGFRVYVPNATASQFVKHRTTGCRNADVHLIAHRPFHHR
ncbi:DUF4232 domain-containing protein [Nocardioides sp. KIGAM211]|uniref:DUF4232 domain-containing protein n=1 Tax=Nocardioides luti TaxID=2761101 RepID=A0A7X0RHR2_9ACTN|nr:DUF4232 domain-containing protein [Nocardioides luti]MBB6627278.1 DUF4232 domain-containing protein [Nocardioides luti]